MKHIIKHINSTYYWINGGNFKHIHFCLKYVYLIDATNVSTTSKPEIIPSTLRLDSGVQHAGASDIYSLLLIQIIRVSQIFNLYNDDSVSGLATELHAWEIDSTILFLQIQIIKVTMPWKCNNCYIICQYKTEMFEHIGKFTFFSIIKPCKLSFFVVLDFRVCQTECEGIYIIFWFL